MFKFILKIFVYFILKFKEFLQNLKKELNDETEISLSASVRKLSQLLKDYNLLYNNIGGIVHGQRPSIKRLIAVTIPEISCILSGIRFCTTNLYQIVNYREDCIRNLINKLRLL